MDKLSATFSALADPTRRAILARLALGETSVMELAKPFAMSLPAGNRGKTRGGQGGRGWVATNSGRYGMAGLPGTASLEPR